MVIEQSTSDRNIFVPGWPWTPRVYETGLPGVAANWWDPNNDIVCANIWAYRAINSAGTPWPGGPTVYAETLVNVVNPGVNDLVEGNGAVPWAQPTGWGFVAAAAQWFDTGLTAVSGWSALCQFANYLVINAVIFGAHIPGPDNGFYVFPSLAAQVRYASGIGSLAVGPTLLTGNLGMAGQTAFRNGVPEPGVIPGGALPPLTTFIGALDRTGVPSFYCTSDIESMWIADCALTAPQILAVATAMSQL